MYSVPGGVNRWALPCAPKASKFAFSFREVEEVILLEDDSVYV